MRLLFYQRQKSLLCFLLALSSLLSTGCYDRQELEQQAFVSIMGIDKAPNGLIDCTFTIAVPVNPSTSGGAKPPLAASGPVTFRGHDITEALILANSSIERTLTLSHLTAVVFGSDLAKEGVMPYLQTLGRFREFRRTVFIAVSKQSAREVIAADMPMLEKSTGRLADDVARVAERSGLVLVRQLHELLTALEDNHADCAVPLYAINEQVKDDPSGKGKMAGKTIDFSAGSVQRLGGNPVEWTGAALFRGDKLVGELDGQGVTYLRILQGNLHTAKLDFANIVPSLGPIALAVKKERNPRYMVQLSKPMQIQVDVPLDVDLLSGGNGQDFSDPTLRKRLEQKLDRQVAGDLTGLLQKLFRQWNIDPIPISKSIRKQFATHQQFEQFPWESSLKQAKVSVQVDIHLRRFGIQSVPPVPARK